jgi:hypothetical protein
VTELESRKSWEWASDAFRALPFWIGYQKYRYRHYPIRELAITTELAALLYTSSQSKGLRVECEKTFPSILGYTPKAAEKYVRCHADLSVSDNKGSVQYVLEIKIERNKLTMSGKQRWCADLERLSWLKQQNKSLEVGLLLCTFGSLPSEFVSKSGRASRKILGFEKGKQKFKIRRIYKAFDTLRNLNPQECSQKLGPTVTLIEPIFF